MLNSQKDSEADTASETEKLERAKTIVPRINNPDENILLNQLKSDDVNDIEINPNLLEICKDKDTGLTIIEGIRSSRIKGLTVEDVVKQLKREGFSDEEIQEEILFARSEVYIQSRDMFPIAHRAQLFSEKAANFRKEHGIELEVLSTEQAKKYAYHGTPRDSVFEELDVRWISAIKNKGLLPSGDGNVHAWEGTPLRALGIDYKNAYLPTFRVNLEELRELGMTTSFNESNLVKDHILITTSARYPSIPFEFVEVYMAEIGVYIPLEQYSQLRSEYFDTIKE